MNSSISPITGPDTLGLSRFPRVDICHQPTPIEPMIRLSEHLGSAQFYIKRDDWTGLAGGGNKTRKLEFLVGDAVSKNADTLVTQGAVQSNHVRQTAAAACRYNLASHALLERRIADTACSYESTGNVLLDRLFGTQLEFRGPGLDMNAEAQATCKELEATGAKPYFIPGGGSNEIGALGYVSCAQELVHQMATMALDFDWIVLATGSTGTQAGLVAGLHQLGYQGSVLGVSVRQPRDKQINAVHSLCQRTLTKLGVDDEIPVSKIKVDDGYVGGGYGIPANSTLEAITIAARYEGLLLDPVYSGKGFAGMLGMARADFFKPTDKVLFLHTGGSSALFAYEDVIVS